MPGITIYNSNRLEVLAGALSDILRYPPGDSVLSREVVMVQSRGMERWLRMRLAEAHGISANIWFPFPNRFFQSIFSEIFPDRHRTELFTPDVAAWRIMEILSACTENPEFGSLYDYLNSGADNLKCFQLSFLLADTFDQYLLFRPEMVFEWEKGEEKHWQADLWRMLSAGHESEHRAAVARDFLSMIDRGEFSTDVFPPRLSVFGISALPRFHMELLAGIGNVIDVNLFLMNPCMEYWGDIVSEKVMLSGRRRVAETGTAVADLYAETGNPLLSSLGILGRDFFDSIGDLPHGARDFFEEPGTDCLLHCVQSDILHMLNRKANGDRKCIPASDRSVQIHACHSPMREVEVLHDVLLDLLDRHKDLACEDIVVMTPDIETYAPFVRSVFEKDAGGGASIPFSIADRSLCRESSSARTLLKILELSGGRYTGAEIVDILESGPVGARFEIQGEQLSIVKRWIRDVRIRWGIDGSWKAGAGLPAFEENTWHFGISRMLLGYALRGRGERTFSGISPYDDIEGQDAELLGRFCTFLKRLFTFTTSFRDSRTPEQWACDLESLLESLFSSSEPFSAELRLLRGSLREIAGASRAAGFSATVDLAAFKWLLARKLDKTEYGSGFISRGVTFCAMLPMRSIPFRVVCLMGLNGDAYPRRSSPPGFDLMARRPRRGDKSRRADDRYLFLEALLSARDVFYLSYVGRSMRDNGSIPPSVVASELLDYISESFTGQAEIMEQVVVNHPLQPFNSGYFRAGGRLFSYSTESFEAARALSGHRTRPAPFMSVGIQPSESEPQAVSMEDLYSFFSNPARHLIKKRLGVTLDDPSFVFEEREPFAVEGLDLYRFENRLLSWLLEEKDPSVLMELVRSEGILPHGNIGVGFFKRKVAEVEAFTRRLRAFTGKRGMLPLEVSLAVSGFDLTGSIDRISEDGIFDYRYSVIKASDMVRAWIKHLVLCLSSPAGVRKRSVIAGLPEKKRGGKDWAARYFDEPSEPKAFLVSLLGLYREGLSRPVPFSPEVSWAYMTSRARGLPEKDALERARHKWDGSMKSRGAAEDPYNDLCFKDTGLVALPGFTDVAARVLGPLISCMEEMN